MMPIERAITFSAGGLRLEGRLHLPEQATRGAVICHPHPQYGGTLDNDVVAVVARALQAIGVATLRFNFRGVGASEGRHDGGVGEVADAQAAVAHLRAAGPRDVLLAGYSFGAAIAARAIDDGALAGTARATGAAQRNHATPISADAGGPMAAGLALIAPPLALFPLDFLAACTVPKLVVVGEHDAYCPLASLERAVADFPEPRTVVIVPGADHFFFGAADIVAAAVARFAAALEPDATAGRSPAPRGAGPPSPVRRT